MGLQQRANQRASAGNAVQYIMQAAGASGTARLVNWRRKWCTEEIAGKDPG